MTVPFLQVRKFTETHSNRSWTQKDILHSVTYLCDLEQPKSSSQGQRVKWWLPGAGGQEEMGEAGKRDKLSVTRRIRSEDLMCNPVTTVGKAVSHESRT